MSQTSSQQPDLENDGHPDQPPSARNQPSQPSQGGSNFGDSSGPLFSMYSKIAEEEDNKMTERWTKDADGILIFTGLFSASVAALLAVSIQDLIPNSQDTSAFYLEKIFEQLFLNVTPSSIPSTIPKPPPFTPPRYAIWVNSLWFLSLVISLTAAQLATSLQQWARRYIRITQPPRCRPEKRARMRAFFADGVDNLHIPWAVEGLPALLHLSLFLFFSGVLILLFNINHTVFLWVVWCVCVFWVIYGWITMIPIFRHDSPYYAPLSGSAWLLYTGISYASFKFLARIGSEPWFTTTTLFRFGDLREDFYRWFVGGLEEAAEGTAWKQSSVIDLRILNWTLGTLGDDDLLEKFFDAIPGFINSSLVRDPERDSPFGYKWTFSSALLGFLHRTLSSNSILDSVKTRRLIICINAADTMNVPEVLSKTVRDVGRERLSLPRSIESGHALACWCTNEDPFTAECAQRIVARIVMVVSEHDNRWIALVKDQFGLPEHVLRDNVAHGDNSVFLSIFIHLTRHCRDNPGPWPWNILSIVSQFDIRHSVPGLQHEFCALWNEIVQEARNQGMLSDPVRLLRPVSHAYIALHQGTEAAPTAFSAATDSYEEIFFWPSSYPLCTLSSHRSDSTPNSPHSAHVEAQPLRAITAVADISIISSEPNLVYAVAQQAEETIITHSSTDLTITRSDNSSPHTQPFPSASPTNEPVDILPQITSVTNPSVLARDLSPPVPKELSHELCQSTLPAIDTSVPEDLATYIHTTETRVTSHTAAATSLTFPHTDLVLVTATPFTGTPPGLPSAFVSGPADVSNAFHDTTTPSATTYTSEISSMAHSIPHSIPGDGATVEGDEEATEVPPIVVSHSRSSPMPMPAPRGNVTPEPFSSIEFPLIQFDSTSHVLGSPSSSATTHSRNVLQVTSILDAHVAGRSRAVSGHDDTRGMDTRIPIEDLPDPNQSTARAPSIDPVTLPPENGKNGQN